MIKLSEIMLMSFCVCFFTGTGEGNSWFNWVSTSTTDTGASSATGVTCGCGSLVKDECFFPGEKRMMEMY